MPKERAPVEVRIDRLDTRQLRALREIMEQVSRGIHSDARMINDDKIRLLARLKKAKNILDRILQVELFTPEQLR